MQIAVWIVQGLLAVAFLGAGLMKLTQPKEALIERGMKFMEEMDAKIVKLIGLLEVAGAIGIIFPVLLNILPFFTPLAAAGLILTMIGAAITHIRRNEFAKTLPNLVLGGLATFVLWQTFALLPL